MPHTALYMGTSHFFGAPYASASQPVIASDLLRRKLELVRELGRGGTGVAFLARMVDNRRPQAWVAKLPLACVREGLRLPARLGDALTRPTERTLAAFADECRNAELALDAQAVRRIRRAHLIAACPELEADPHALMRAETGARLCDLSADEFARARAARREWTRLPGYAHLHPVLHFDRDLPLLLSLPALGSARDLRVALHADEPLPGQWCAIAWQLSEAVQFLMDYPQLAHLDIKPDNVLYNRRDGGVHCWLSDYGDLCPKARRADFRRGTAHYKPERAPVEATAMQQSLHGFYATLMNLFLFPVDGGEVSHLSRHGNIGAAVARDRWLEAHAPAELRAHAMAPLLDLDGIEGAFDATRAWLAGTRAPRGEGLLELA